MNYVERLKIMETAGQAAIKAGLFFITPDKENFDGNSFSIKGNKVVNLTSCSYLGLEMREELIEGSVQAARNFGTQYSSCRAFAQCPLYEELEELLEKIFDGYIAVNLSTTFAHLATLPILVNDGSVLVLDQQSHHCLKLISDYLYKRNIQSETIKHSNLQNLEILIEANSNRDIWYLTDGIYSMYGDFSPISDLIKLLNRYPNFNVYVDDAHGMSWFGKKGRGYALNQDRHERMIVATSLCKAFGAAGGCAIFPNSVLRNRVRLLGGPFIWGGPIQPPMLGAAVSSAKLHLDGTIDSLQISLRKKIRLFNDLCLKKQIPLVADNEVPIRYIGLGKQDITNMITKKLLDSGFYAAAVCFPSVSKNRTGIRIGITNHLTMENIERLVFLLSTFVREALSDGDIKRIKLSFRRAVPTEVRNHSFFDD